MVKIVEEAEEERSESTSRRMSLDTSPPHTLSPLVHASPLPSGSPDSSSSISSAHTFHGFSAKPSPLQFPLPTSNRLVRDEPPPSVAKTQPGPLTGFADPGGATDYESGVDGSVGDDEGGRGRPPPMFSSFPPSISRRAKRVVGLRKVAIVLRWFGFAVCLVSFSVMTSDRSRGWALDSFDRYKEFRYTFAVNVIGCVYSGLQGCCLAHQLRKGKHITQTRFWCSINFMVDQMLAYLLMSASSSAATRVDDWIMNWGKDKFTTMAGASVAMSFLAFAAFALSSMISGYLLCTRRST